MPDYFGGLVLGPEMGQKLVDEHVRVILAGDDQG
jgi:hypothetical protein